MIPLVNSLKRPVQFGLLVALGAAIISFAFPNYYKSTARILPMESKASAGMSGLAAAAAAFGVGTAGGEGGEANYTDILNSRWMHEKLLSTRFSYKVRRWRWGKEVTVTQTLFDYIGEKNMDRAVRELDQYTFATRDLKTKILTFGIETRSADLSQQVVRQMTSLLEGFVQERGRTRGGYKAAFAEARLRETRDSLAEAENALRKFLEANRNYLVSNDPAVKILGNRLETEYKLRQQLVSTLSMNLEQSLLEEKNDIPVLNVMDPANLPEEKSSPTRGLYVLAAFFLTSASLWVWENRVTLGSRFSTSDLLA